MKANLFFLLIAMAGNSALGQLIQLGAERQLFVDDSLIESISGARRVMNPAVKVKHNPVIRPEHPWEGKDVRVSHVFPDEKTGTFKMIYSGYTFRATQGEKEIIVDGEGQPVTCLATSKDGIHWEKPVLNLVEFNGSKANNLIPKEQVMPYMFRDSNETDPEKLYKGLIRHGSTDTTMQFDLYFSPDGLSWTPYKKNPVIDTSPRIGRWGPTEFMGWDPIRKTYAAHLENCLHQRCSLDRRLIGRVESRDMIHWGVPETIIVPDEKDYPDTEFYDMPAITYQNVYVGLLWNFRTTDTTILPQIVFSRDGIHYNREFREPFIRRGDNGDFDSSVVYPDQPVVVDGRTFSFYTGANWRSPEHLLELGDEAIGAIGLAISRQDGFVSVNGAKGAMKLNRLGTSKVGASTFSQLTTRSFSFSGSRLYLNMKSALRQWGAGPCEVRVEILGPDHQFVKGYGFEEADSMTTGGLAEVVSWKGSSDLSKLKGKPIKLRFYFKNVKLYSFVFK